MVYLEYINYCVLVVRYRLSSCSDSMREEKVLILEHTFKRFYKEEGEFEILTLASWFSHYSYSRTSIRSSMGGWLGKYSMLSKVLMSKKKEKNEKKRKRKEKKRRIKCSLVLFGFINFPSYFEELFHTQIFQPCAIRYRELHLYLGIIHLPLAHVHLSKCVSFIFLPLQYYFPMAFLTSLGNSIR